MRPARRVEGHAAKRAACGEEAGRNPAGAPTGAQCGPRVQDHSNPAAQQLIEQMVEKQNMRRAWQQVRRNKGAPGVDGRNIDATLEWLQEHWEQTRQQLLAGSYKPKPVRRVEIPKPGGGMRKLGIPTVLDRLIQQAMHQVMTPLFDPDFSDNSYGFRPGRSAHGAILKAQEYQRNGKRWVVDMDLKQFFDEVDHDILMSRLGRKVKDSRMKRLINRYLKAGVMTQDGVEATERGTPQGGPLSPLLSNIMLDDLDRELERRGHSFCRYADDCNIYVRSRRSGERVLASVSRFVERKLKLKVNQEKSAVARPVRRTFLGYSFTVHRRPKIRVPAETVQRFRRELKARFRAGRGRNLGRFIKEELNPVLRGWIEYFRLAEVDGFAEDLDKWLRHRLRTVLWRQWKRGRTRYQRLRGRGLSDDRARQSAYNGRGAWWNAGASHMNEAIDKRYLETAGLLSLLGMLRNCRRTLT